MSAINRAKAIKAVSEEIPNWEDDFEAGPGTVVSLSDVCTVLGRLPSIGEEPARETTLDGADELLKNLGELCAEMGKVLDTMGKTHKLQREMFNRLDGAPVGQPHYWVMVEGELGHEYPMFTVGCICCDQECQLAGPVPPGYAPVGQVLTRAELDAMIAAVRVRLDPGPADWATVNTALQNFAREILAKFGAAPQGDES